MAAKKWRLAHSLTKLREQINAAAPNRSRASDGDIGDARHAATKSDHNPVNGVVHAIDITHDPKGGFDAGQFAETLRERRDRRIYYVIFNGRIFNANVHPWEWRKYAGQNKHDKHVHVSVNVRFGDDGSAWRL